MNLSTTRGLLKQRAPWRKSAHQLRGGMLADLGEAGVFRRSTTITLTICCSTGTASFRVWLTIFSGALLDEDDRLAPT